MFSLSRFKIFNSRLRPFVNNDFPAWLSHLVGDDADLPEDESELPAERVLLLFRLLLGGAERRSGEGPGGGRARGRTRVQRAYAVVYIQHVCKKGLRIGLSSSFRSNNFAIIPQA